MNKKEQQLQLETLAIHGGYVAEETTRAAVTPIYQTTSYTFRDTQHGADLFDLKEQGNIYTRIMNPTTAVLETRINLLEGGVGALALSSGMAAITNTLFALAGKGDNIISAPTLYGGTYNLFAHTLPNFGIETRFCELTLENLDQRIDENTKMVFCESIGNPAGNVADLEPLASYCTKQGIALVVDNTVATPCLCRPFEFGAHIVIHSLTKYIGGHGNSIGGIIVDSGQCDWAASTRYPLLTQPDPSYHNIVYTKQFGNAAFIARARLVPLRNMGAALSPFNSFLILQGLETLPLRMQRHSHNALKIAQYLQAHPQVKWVRYAGLPQHPDFEKSQCYLQDGKASGILSFGIEGGRTAGARFIDALELILHLVNIGDARSLACHPATTTHRQLSQKELIAAGASEDLIRLSIGIEHVDDLIADIDQAIAKASA